MKSDFKLSYEYVSKEVDKFYQKEFDLNDTQTIDEHCQFIVTFINACGWTEDEYIRAMFGFAPLEQMN